jgi:ABC-2 type transport system ATP-binding protein
MAYPVIRLENLVKEFNQFRAVDRLSFEVNKGEFFGLLGPNGAGKTTTIRILTGIFKPTEGQAFIGQYNIQENPLEVKEKLGIVPEMANAYMDLSAWRNLLLVGELYGVEKKKREEEAERLLKLFHLYEKRKEKVKFFSKGMKQRLILAMALMNNEAEILFLDEPTSGLDVESVRLIRDIIGRLNQQGLTIFLTTHNIEEANLLCDRVAIMNHGKIVVIDRPENLKQTIQSTASIEVAFEEKVSPEELKLEGVAEVRKIGDKFRLYTQKPGQVIPLLVERAKEKKKKIISLNTLGPSLEDAFVKLTKREE